MEGQVWTWLWEYCIKFKQSDICQDVEQQFLRGNVFPELKSLSLFLLVRQMQQLLYSPLQSQKELQQLKQVLEDILSIKVLQFHIKFHKEIIRTYLSVNMILSAGDDRNRIMKKFSNKYWKTIKKKFDYEDDDYKNSYEEGHNTARKALENGLNSQLENRTLKLLNEALSLLESTFRYMLPTTALENLCNPDVREYLQQQEEVPVYAVLLKTTKKGVTKDTARNIFQWLIKNDELGVQTENGESYPSKKKKDQISIKGTEEESETIKSKRVAKFSRNKESIQEVVHNVKDNYTLIAIAGKSREIAGAPRIMVAKQVDRSKSYPKKDISCMKGNKNIVHPQENIKMNTHTKVKNDALNLSQDLILFKGKSRNLKNANLVKRNSGNHKEKEKLRSNSRNSISSSDEQLNDISGERSNQESEIRDLEILILLVEDYLSELKKKLKFLKKKRKKESHKTTGTICNNVSSSCKNLTSNNPKNCDSDVQISEGNNNFEKSVEVNKSCNVSDLVLLTEKDIYTGINQQLCKNVTGQELLTAIEKKLDENESINRINEYSTDVNKSLFSKQINLCESNSHKQSVVKLGKVNETEYKLEEQKQNIKSNKPLTLKDAKRRINFNSGEDEDASSNSKDETVFQTVSCGEKTNSDGPLPHFLMENNTEEDEESLRLEMSNSDSLDGEPLEKDSSNLVKDVEEHSSLVNNLVKHQYMLDKQRENNISSIKQSFESQILQKSVTDSENKCKYFTTNNTEVPIVSSAKSIISESSSTNKQADSQFFSFQDEYTSYVKNFSKEDHSDVVTNITTEDLVDMNRKITAKRKRRHSYVKLLNENFEEILSDDIATCVKTSPRKRKPYIIKDLNEFDTRHKVKAQSDKHKALDVTNISPSKNSTKEKNKRVLYNNPDSLSVSFQDDSGENSEDFFTPEGSPASKSGSSTKNSPNIRELANEAAVKLSKKYTKMFGGIMYSIFN